MDHVPQNIAPSNNNNNRVHLFVFEDNEAVMKMIIKRRRPNMRDVSRTHRFDRSTDVVNSLQKLGIS